MNNKRDQTGQSLIETIVAIFVLTTALAAGLGLTIYAFGTSTTSLNEIIATNLAREGIEVVRMMRDSNWLSGDAAGGGFALQSCADIAGRFCYPADYVGPAYNFYLINPPSPRAVFNSTTNTWILDQNTNYDMFLQADGTYTHTASGTSVFARKLAISSNTASPYTATNPELIVQSIVGWRGKNCTAMVSQDPSTTNCRVVIEEHLTNWKDYK